MVPLTTGAVSRIMGGDQIDSPVLQVLGIKKLNNSANGSDRYRLLVSDGIHISSFTMLATQLNYMITQDIITQHAIIQITRYAMSKANASGKAKQIMVVLNVEVKVEGSAVNEKIGNPRPYEMNNVDNDEQAAMMNEANNRPAPPPPPPVARPPQNRNAAQQNRLNNSIASGTEITTTPIAALSPYSNKWVIKARVSNKTERKTWSNSRGEGCLFSMDFVDESGEIRCTAFREQVDRFFDFVEMQKVYYVSRAQIKIANKTFNATKCDYEMTITGDTEIVPCHDDSESIPLMVYDFIPLERIGELGKDEIIDVIAVVKGIDNVVNLTSKAGKELRKREVELVDESCTTIVLTLWGKQAEDFTHEDHPILAIKSAKIGEFNGGKTLSSMMSSSFQLEPDLPQAHKLRGWYTNEGANIESKSLSKVGGAGGSMIGNWTTLEEAAVRGAHATDAPETFICKALINIVRHENAVYKACPTENCNKKVVESNDMYRCEKCNRDFPRFKPRLLAHMAIADWTTTVWATAFNDEVEKMIGLSAHELKELEESNLDDFQNKFTDIAFHSFIFKLRMNMRVYNDQAKLNTTIVAVSPVNYKTYNTHLLKQIKLLANIEK